jgi:hypothetical protein
MRAEVGVCAKVLLTRITKLSLRTVANAS